MIARYAIAFFLFVGLVLLPLLVWLLCRWLLPRRWHRWVALACTLLIYILLWYGTHQGFDRLEVRQVQFASADLPAAFDGYRIVQFSDAHVGTYEAGAPQLQRLVDTINGQHADAIVFTGDLQNLQPQELLSHVAVLSQLHAPDGVFSVLGNHDYAVYLDLDSLAREANNRETQRLERQMGWTLLMNEHRIIRRGADSIVIAGMENWGKARRMPRRGDVCQTLAPLADSPSPFTIMLQHDPTAWREKILPECGAQLTLSGHTHGGQFSLLGWSPVALAYTEWGGMTYEGPRAINVSTGVGGLIPFRLGMPGEIVVITLRKNKKTKE